MAFFLLPALPALLPGLTLLFGAVTQPFSTPSVGRWNSGWTSSHYVPRYEPSVTQKEELSTVAVQVPKIIETGATRAGYIPLDNPCDKDNGGCSHICRNVDGRAECRCRRGYMLAMDGKTCIPKPLRKKEHRKEESDDSPESSGEECQHPCMHEGNGMNCTCPVGYKLDDENCCTDIDECADNNFGCSHICINTPGGADCFCPVGYGLYDHKTCIGECPPGTKWSESSNLCEQIKRRQYMRQLIMTDTEE